MTILLKIILSALIFCAGFWLGVTILINNSSGTEIGAFIIFPATLAGIIAIWKYRPKKKVNPGIYEDAYKFVADTSIDFIDYYQLLQLEIYCTNEQLKAAYKQQAVLWHPDKNPGIDTTSKMQQINEAFLILKDADSRILYDQEYLQYQKFSEQKRQYSSKKIEYQFQNETLNGWIMKARRQAAELAKRSLEDTNNMAIIGGKVIVNQLVMRTIIFIVIAFIFSILAKGCG
jgi:hypothetical protein